MEFIISEYDDRRLKFEEYKLYRDTAIHFDKILISIRKSTIILTFIIFGLVVGALRITNVPFGLNAVDLALILVLIELLMIMSFFHLEFHYRFYLVQISKIAVKYEEKLGLGMELEECDWNCDNKISGISKCLTCIHENEMAFFTRVAHFNIYANLLSLGLVVFTALMGIKINLSYEEIFIYTIIVGIIAFGCSIIYPLREIKKQNEDEKNGLDDNFLVYIVSIISFVMLTYILYYIEFIEFPIQNMKFAFAFFGALVISIIIFHIYSSFREKIDRKFQELLIYIHVIHKKKDINKDAPFPEDK